MPVEQIERVSPLLAAASSPSCASSAATEWLRTKQRVRKAVDDLAEELLELYAARATRPGHAFGDDTPWQAEMEASFPYEETPDQLRAVAEVKADMEAGRPMDRLVVGDVGYGKTEVALRAAFKAIQDGKQVAVLVPDDGPRRAAPQDVRPAVRGIPDRRCGCCRGSSRRPSRRRRSPASRTGRSTS